MDYVLYRERRGFLAKAEGSEYYYYSVQEDAELFWENRMYLKVLAAEHEGTIRKVELTLLDKE